MSTRGIGIDTPRINTLVRRVVSSSDRDSASRCLADIQKALEVCQAKTDALKDRLSILEAERNRLLEAEKTYKSLLAPIHRLPTELLAYTFMLSCGEFTLDLSSLPPPVQLSMVCGRWREVAFATPYLWSYLDFALIQERTFNPISSMDGHRTLRIVLRFLEVSGNHPLTLKIDVYYGMPRGSLPSYVIDALVLHSHRWATLEISVDEFLLNLPSWLPIRGRLPLLRYLHVAGVGEHGGSEMPTIDLFSVCPALRSACIDVADDLILPKMQIKSLKLHDWLASTALPLLNDAGFDYVEDLGLHVVGSDFDEDYNINDGQACMRRVKRLEVSGGEHVHIAHAFNTLTAPALSTLVISCQYCTHDGLETLFSPRSWDNQPIVDFLVRSSCNITQFHLKWAPMTDKDVMHLFQWMPHILSLTIEECSLHADGRQENNIVVPAFLEHLRLDNSSSSSKPLLPHLASLNLVVHADVNLQLLLEVLRSRQSRLRATNIAIIGQSDDADIEEFSAFRCLGLEMTIERYHNWIEH